MGRFGSDDSQGIGFDQACRVAFGESLAIGLQLALDDLQPAVTALGEIML